VHPEQTGQPDEPRFDDVTWLRPSPRMWTARQTLLAVVAVPVTILATVAATAGGSGAAGVVVLVLLLVAAACWWLVLRGRYRAWRYAERHDDLLVRRGLLISRLTVVPYGRMQLIEVTAGPIDRIFALATVQLHTASASTDARIPGLPVEEAQRLRDKLAALGEARAAGL
jgi:membrane protein YdbS with pleckstrin-like domain